MNELQVFTNPEFGQVRTVTIEEEPWFVGKDVAVALGYESPRAAVSKKVDPEDKGVSEMETPSGKQTMTIINESGLYALIFGSKLESAKRFKHWVTHDVLPAIRKTGSYSIIPKARALTTDDYMKAAQLAATCRNERLPFLEKVNAIPGVGGVKVYRVWNSDLNPAKLIPPTGTDTWISGLSDVPEAVKSWLDAVFHAAQNNKLTVGGTVKLVIINSTFTVPSPSLVEQVQTAVDPLQNAGEGVGIAPIGHVVRVEGVQEETVNLAFSLYYQRDWDWDDVSGYVTEAIKSYFTELAESWADQTEPLVVRISQIESRLLGISGILDIANTKINDEASNFTLELDHIPVLGSISPSVITINA